ncbi:MAG: YARHG domain-containing protein [Desulfobacterales bacterium]|uniref:YARHG domain-containing protein n=1 Tax=Candidatus Desulfatibia vada TaxID=2841696 RepID=A0A8J6NUC4_9BACT|nr:YARHG domain-containing protein [Candidatus Desulfatibia vada]MBL6970489.1 YARHG domain-containing protein [Desulfobacterales bacterium]MBL7217043.1 YARHG domain-containing protein [Desulfobacteraceae bacterium]
MKHDILRRIKNGGKVALVLILLLYSVILSGCKFECTSNIYTSDIIEVRNAKKPLFAESTIKIEVLDRSSYEQNKAQIRDLFSRHFQNVKDLSCEEIGLNTFVVGRTKIPIWFNPNIEGTYSSRQLLSIMVADLRKKEQMTKVFLAVDRESYLALKKDIENQFLGATISVDDMKITIILHNDQRHPVTAFGTCVYINGQPEPEVSKIVLERRDSVELIMPTISIAKAFEVGRSPFLLFQLENAEIATKQVDPEPARNEKRPDKKQVVQSISKSPWLFPELNKRYIKDEELKALSKDQLWRAKSELLARHGYIFKTPRGKSFAKSLGTHYKGTVLDVNIIYEQFNEYEKVNTDMIEKREKKSKLFNKYLNVK